MGVIKGSNVNPAASQVQAMQCAALNAVEKKQEKEVLEKRFERWRKFADTKEGKDLMEAAEPAIKRLNAYLALSTLEIAATYGIPLDMVQEQRAEWRGELRTWNWMITEPAFLKSEFEKIEGEPLDEKKKPTGWASGPPKRHVVPEEKKAKETPAKRASKKTTKSKRRKKS